MLIKSRSVQGRELLFELSTQISSKYFLKLIEEGGHLGFFSLFRQVLLQNIYSKSFEYILL